MGLCGKAEGKEGPVEASAKHWKKEKSHIISVVLGMVRNYLFSERRMTKENKLYLYVCTWLG